MNETVLLSLLFRNERNRTHNGPLHKVVNSFRCFLLYLIVFCCGAVVVVVVVVRKCIMEFSKFVQELLRASLMMRAQNQKCEVGDQIKSNTFWQPWLIPGKLLAKTHFT